MSDTQWQNAWLIIDRDGERTVVDFKSFFDANEEHQAELLRLEFCNEIELDQYVCADPVRITILQRATAELYDHYK